jgi:hypothetical protein
MHLERRYTMLRQTLVDLSASALLSATIGATTALAFPFGPRARDGLYGYATGGGYSSDGYSDSSNGGSYVYGYRGDAHRRVVVCSDN